MIDEIISWVGKKLNSIDSSLLFKDYFRSCQQEELENTIYLSNKTKGIELVMTNTLIITSIHLFSGNNSRNNLPYNSFTGKLPGNLEFSFSREDIHLLLGIPSESGGGQEVVYLGYVPIWDKYYFNNYSIHIQYSNTFESFNMLTVSSLILNNP